MKPRLCLDFSAIKTGGGLQLATSFVLNLEASGLPAVMAIVPEDSSLKRLLARQAWEGTVIAAPRALGPRLLFEHTQLQAAWRRQAITHIFTFFGAGLPHPESIRSVVSLAYPIICYPDSRYWEYVPRATKIRQMVINRGRIQRLAQYASEIIVETPVMHDRIKNNPLLRAKRVRVIAPAPSDLVAYVENPSAPHTAGAIRLLALSSLSVHKNLWRLPEIARHLRIMGAPEFKVVVTAQRQAFIDHCRAIKASERLCAGWERDFEFIGEVAPESVAEIIDRCHYLINLSDLESFSNNYMEALRRGRPLIASDRDYSRWCMGDTAIFVEPHDPSDVARRIYPLLTASESLRQSALVGERRNAVLAQRLVAAKERIRQIESAVVGE